MPTLLETAYRPRPCQLPQSIPFVQHQPPYKPEPYPLQVVTKQTPFSLISKENLFCCKTNISGPCPQSGNFFRIYCMPFGVVTNQKTSRFNRYACNYPGLTFAQIKELIAKEDALPPIDQCRIVDIPYFKWYSWKSYQANMPSSIPFTQHLKDTPFPDGGYGFELIGDPCTDEGNNRYSCNKDAYPIAPPFNGLNPPVASIPYTQHRRRPVLKKTYGTIKPFNYCNMFNYLINQVNKFIEFYYNPMVVTPKQLDIANYDITPSDLWNGWLATDGEVTGPVEGMTLPSPADVCKIIKKKMCRDPAGKAFNFVLTNQHATGSLPFYPAVGEPDMFSKWNSGVYTTQIIIRPMSSLWVQIYIESCKEGEEKYYVLMVLHDEPP